MRFISSRDFRIKPGEIWEMLEQGEDIVITSHGKPFGVLVGANENNMQQLLNELVRLRAKLAITNMRITAQAKGLSELSDEALSDLIEDAGRNDP